MATVNIRQTRPRIIIPTDSDGYAKITITADNGTVYTILDSYGGAEDNNYLLSGSVTRVDTDKLGSFKFTIANDMGYFLNKFDGGEVVKIYGDLVDATTLIFQGKIDDVKYGLNMNNGFYITVDGRDYPELTDGTITGVEAATKADIGVAGILNEFYNNITLMFWNGSSWSEATYTESTDTVSWSPAASNFPTALVNMTYQNRKGMTVIREILKKVGIGCYLWYENTNSRWTLRTYVCEDISSDHGNIAYGINLVNLGTYGANNSEIVNRAIVYGKVVSDNILLLKTENDTTSQGNLWVKDRVFNESDLDTMEEVQDKADQALADGINNANTGSITALFMPGLNPGEMVSVSIPYTPLNGSFKVQSLTHNFGQQFTTKLNLTRNIKGIGELFIPKVNPDEFVSAISNPNNMTDSYSVYFDESPAVVTLSNTEIVENRLRLVSGQTSGTATSDTITTDYEVSECELRKFENYETVLDVYEVSNNNGASWETYTELEAGQRHVFSAPGDRLKFRITLNRANAGDTSPSYEALCILYKN